MSQLSKKVLGAGAAMVALSAFVPNPFLIGEAMAQATAQDTMDITAKIVNPMDVSQVTKMNFGSIAVGALTNNKIILNSTAAVSVSVGDAIYIGGAINGKVAFNAPPSATFTISVTDFAASPIQLTNGGVTDDVTMKVDNIYLYPDTTGKLQLGGTTLKVGATNMTAKITGGGTSASAIIGGRLTDVDETQVVGTYRGTYTMSVTL